jgi:predicted RNA-binding Zn-ribbon protein involved in translation (DUF1610 family)
VIPDAIQANKTACIMEILDDLDVSIPCPTCGKRTEQTISRLKCLCLLRENDPDRRLRPS